MQGPRAKRDWVLRRGERAGRLWQGCRQHLNPGKGATLTTLSGQDWRLRAYAYDHVVAHERPPTFVEAAADFGIDAEEARHDYRRLHGAHALFLDPGGRTVARARDLFARLGLLSAFWQAVDTP